MLKNKRGIGLNYGVWIFYVLAIIIFFVFLDISIEKKIVQTVDTFGLERDILQNRLFYSQNSFFYFENGRSYLGIIKSEDIETKFTENTLNKLFDKESNFDIAFKIQLTTIDKTIFFNKNLFETGQSLADIKGSKYSLRKNILPVAILNNDGTYEKAFLIIQGLVSK